PLDIPAAEGYYREAFALANELGMRPLAAHCHLGLGKLYHRTGDAAKAHEHLTTASTLYREMGMTFWLEKAEASLEGCERWEDPIWSLAPRRQPLPRVCIRRSGERDLSDARAPVAPPRQPAL